MKNAVSFLLTITVSTLSLSTVSFAQVDRNKDLGSRTIVKPISPNIVKPTGRPITVESPNSRTILRPPVGKKSPRILKTPDTASASRAATNAVAEVQFGHVYAYGLQPLALKGDASTGSAPLTYSWSGPLALNSNNIANPLIAALPDVQSPASYQFTLTVTDASSQASTDTVSFTVVPTPCSPYDTVNLMNDFKFSFDSLTRNVNANYTLRADTTSIKNRIQNYYGSAYAQNPLAIAAGFTFIVIGRKNGPTPEIKFGFSNNLPNQHSSVRVNEDPSNVSNQNPATYDRNGIYDSTGQKLNSFWADKKLTVDTWYEFRHNAHLSHGRTLLYDYNSECKQSSVYFRLPTVSNAGRFPTSRPVEFFDPDTQTISTQNVPFGIGAQVKPVVLNGLTLSN